MQEHMPSPLRVSWRGKRYSEVKSWAHHEIGGKEEILNQEGRLSVQRGDTLTIEDHWEPRDHALALFGTRRVPSARVLRDSTRGGDTLEP